MSFWTRKPDPRTADLLLLDSFLKLEALRVDRRSDLEQKRDELEVKKLELEFSHLEARTRATIELDKAKEELRQKRKEAGRIGIAKRRAMARPGALGCELCRDPNTRNVTVPMIEAHRSHEAREAIPELQRGN